MRVGMRVIRDEHRALAAVVDALVEVLALVEGGRAEPDFELLEAFLSYIAGFPVRQHHPKEDAVLFPAVARRTGDLDSLIAALRTQHEEDHRKVADLTSLLTAWTADPTGKGAFVAAARDYARFTNDHINIEESRIIKRLPSLLTEDDWDEVDRAFGDNVDPLIDRATEGEFAHLFQVITMRAPAPIGLGGR